MPTEESRRRQVLWVDDEPHTMECEEVLLVERGVSITWATSIAQATRELQHGEYDLLVLDCMLPSDGADVSPAMAGLEFLRTLRSQAGGPRSKRSIPAIVFTAVTEHSILSHMSAQGVECIIIKPEFPEQVCKVILAALENSEPGN